MPSEQNFHQENNPLITGFQCPFCPKMYACRRTWRRRRHVTRYECREPGLGICWKCHLCPSKYTQSGGLKKHLKNFHKTAVSLRGSNSIRKMI